MVWAPTEHFTLPPSVLQPFTVAAVT